MTRRPRVVQMHTALRSCAAEARAILEDGDLLRRRTAFGYLGWARAGNLGDDLMLEAHQELLSPRHVALFPRTRVDERLRLLARMPGGLQLDAVLLGGGTLFGRPEWWQRVQSVRTVVPGAPWMALGVGVEDEAFKSHRSFTDRPTMERWAEFASSWPVLGVRGPRSLEILQSYGLNAEMTGDPALALSAGAQRPVVRERLLGVSVAMPEARWGNAERVRSAVDDALMGLRASGWCFRFFVFSKWDEPLTRELSTRLGRKAEIFRPTTTADLLRALGECQVVLGERLHSVVMSVAAHTPCVAVEYRPKLRDFMRSLDREKLALRPDRGTAAELRNAVTSLAENRDHESAQLAHMVDVFNARLRDAARRVLLAVDRGGT
jgi:Polysaccharide pyruvyl transferase